MLTEELTPPERVGSSDRDRTGSQSRPALTLGRTTTTLTRAQILPRTDEQLAFLPGPVWTFVLVATSPKLDG